MKFTAMENAIFGSAEIGAGMRRWQQNVLALGSASASATVSNTVPYDR